MRRFLVLLLALGVGMILGRRFEGVSNTAEAGGGNAGGEALPPCQDSNGDGQSNLTDAVFLLNWLFLGGSAPTCPASNGQPSGLPDTGQTTCHDQNGTLVPCESDTCRGQDGFYQSGCPSDDRFLDNGDGTVTDNCTGLMWQKDTGDTEGAKALAWCDAVAYCEDLILAGHDDWRLPNIRELESIVDYGRSNPSIDPVFGAAPGTYWSSTSYAEQSRAAWQVHFGGSNITGVNSTAFKGINKNLVRALRNAP